MAARLHDFWQQANAASAHYSMGAWLFLRALGIIYATAFLSLAVQIKGLAGRQGILPAREFLADVKERFGRRRFLAVPTVFWFNQSDAFLQCLCWICVLFSTLLVAGIAPMLMLILLWVSYLSLLSVMRLLLGYQWDILLLETGFLAIFLAPLRFFSMAPVDLPPWPVLLLVYWLLFRLMFLSGLAKWRSGDMSWRRLTALAHHYETQPLPTPLAWFAHQLPQRFHKFSAVLMFVIELLVPFLIFAPPPYRHVGGLLIVGLMLAIMLTGNYCFFNLLAIALCLPLFDNDFYERLFPWIGTTAQSSSLHLRGEWLALPGMTIFALSMIRLFRLFRSESPLVIAVNQFLDSFPIANCYGLFSVMTTTRMEIMVEGSRDGRAWRPYHWKWKPCDPKRAPPWVAPLQPRLDWQMWFAALGDYRLNGWFIAFLVRLLQGSRPVLALLPSNPFPEGPPTYIRAVLYEYHFTDRKTRRVTGAWWTRQRRALYCPVYSLRGEERGLMPAHDF
jgi:hypothetical protein